MATLQQIDACSLEEILAAVRADGACIALNVLSDELCDALLTDFQAYVDDMHWGIDELGYRDAFYGDRTKRLHGLFSKSRRMEEVLTHPLFLALAKRMFIDTDIAHDIRLSNTELMVLSKDQGVQTFHTDAASWRRLQNLEKQSGNEILISANCALTDFTETNGATRVVPGSHLWGEEREPEESEICLAVMPKGSALIYTGNALHSGGANTGDDDRTGLYLGYIVSWLRPIENQLVTNDAKDVMALSQEAQRLLDVSEGGFTVYA